jgi:hypothetical protein
MALPQKAIPFRLAHSSLQFALRFWPAETRDWGHALAAELHEIEKPFEALRWAIGGLMLFSRASASHFLAWLKLPAGARFSDNPPVAGNGPLLPRRPRFFTAAVLLATALVFLLPQSQEAVSTIAASWRGYGATSSDFRALERLGERAEKENAPRTLAFVAMTLPHSDRATAFANRAISLDPALFWIDAVRMESQPGYALPTQVEMARLLDSDKGNAYPELLAARMRFQPRYTALVHTHSPTDQEVDALAASDPQWLAHMECAFSSPRYDSYINRNWQLTREVWSRENSFSPSVVFYSLWSHSFTDMSSIEAYRRIQFRKAHEATLKKVDSFGRLVSDDGQPFIDSMLGLHLSRQATIELLHLYQNTNRPTESVQASQRIEQIAATLNVRKNAAFARASHSKGLEGRAYFVQSAAVAGLILLLGAVLSFFIVELRSDKSGSSTKIARKLLCFASDWAPISGLFACLALVWAFQPFAQILATARTVMTASDAWFTLHHDGLFRLAPALPFYDRIWSAYHLWQAATYALGALALFILFRRFLLTKRA